MSVALDKSMQQRNGDGGNIPQHLKGGGPSDDINRRLNDLLNKKDE